MDKNYNLYEYAMRNRGIIAKWIVDDPPGQYSYLNLSSCESRQENSLDSRFGSMMITTNGTNNTPLTDTNVHTLRRLKGIGNTWRYAGAGSNLYRRTGDTNGAYATINPVALSGNRFSADVYRPSLSSSPYLYIADQLAMLKDNGSGNATNWGIAAPTVPPSLQLLNNSILDIDNFESAIGSYTTVNVGAGASVLRVNTTIGAIAATGIQAATPAAMTNIVPGVLLEIDTAGNAEEVQVISTTTTTFTANFTKTHAAATACVDHFIQGTVAANTTATVSRTAALNLAALSGTPSPDSDLISLFINISDPSQVQEIRILFDVGDGSFTQNYYMKAVAPDASQPVVSGTSTASAGVTSRVFARAGGLIDTQAIGSAFTPLLPVDDPPITQIQPPPLNTGLNQWSLIQVKKQDFLPVGLAGTTAHTWANVNAWRVSIQTTTTGSITFGVDDFYLLGGSGLTSFGGVSYDWRYTYYNAATGDESNPSVTLVDTSFLLPINQPVRITWTASGDPQVTHVRLWRRGGSLSVGWNLVTSIPIGTTTFVDTIADSLIVTNDQLAIDNDMPVTTALAAPFASTLGDNVTAGALSTVHPPGGFGSLFAGQTVTVGTGANQETVILQIVTIVAGFHVVAFFQNAHSSGDPIVASTRPNTPMNLMAIAFDQAWLAGDPLNPHILYYSKRFNPASFPPQNNLEIGKPDDPIMAVMNFRSLLTVMTVSRIYTVFSPGGGTPQAYPTGEFTYGLVANFGYCMGNGEIKYQSKDGIRSWRGAASTLMTLNVDWLETGQTFGPIVPADKTQFASTLMEYFNREMYVSYVGTDGNRHRLIWSDDYQRYRNDDIRANALFVEQDTNKLLYSTTAGLIWQDRVGDFDDAGFSGGIQLVSGIPMNLQTPYLDQGKPKFKKVYQELMIDIDTQGSAPPTGFASQPISVALIFDNGLGPTVNLGNITQVGRAKVNLPPINSGNGQEGYNVSLKLTGNVVNLVTIREFAFKAVIETDTRKSLDTYWQDENNPEWKLLKQGWFNYRTPGNQPITLQIFTDGNMTTPEFTTTLPATLVRQPLRVRFGTPQGPIKCRTYRFVLTSTADFLWYSESFCEIRGLSGQKGYTRKPLQSAA